MVKTTKPTVAKALAATAKTRYFKIGDRVKFFVYSLLLKRGIWARGAISGLNPAEWSNLTKKEWDKYFKNNPVYEFISKNKSTGLIRYKDYNNMRIHVLIDKKYHKHLEPGHIYKSFQATVHAKERNVQDGAYRRFGRDDNLVFENEKTPFNSLTRKSKPLKRISKKGADNLPF